MLNNETLLETVGGGLFVICSFVFYIYCNYHARIKEEKQLMEKYPESLAICNRKLKAIYAYRRTLRRLANKIDNYK